MNWLQKGDRVKAVWFQATDGVVAGMQPKVCAVQRTVIGVITHIRGDHPVTPTQIRLWVKPDGGGEDVIVDPAHVVQMG